MAKVASDVKGRGGCSGDGVGCRLRGAGRSRVRSGQCCLPVPVPVCVASCRGCPPSRIHAAERQPDLTAATLHTQRDELQWPATQQGEAMGC